MPRGNGVRLRCYNTLDYGMQRTLRFMEEIKGSTLEQLEFEMFQI